ncbi:hypothetical protein NMY22_g5580 [Coprinellus aureogranulatus]|nr:hypothetical protein NMY22_g5580 [Coprinellus aureogranulatus]
MNQPPLNINLPTAHPPMNGGHPISTCTNRYLGPRATGTIFSLSDSEPRSPGCVDEDTALSVPEIIRTSFAIPNSTSQRHSGQGLDDRRESQQLQRTTPTRRAGQSLSPFPSLLRFFATISQGFGNLHQPSLEASHGGSVPRSIEETTKEGDGQFPAFKLLLSQDD